MVASRSVVKNFTKSEVFGRLDRLFNEVSSVKIFTSHTAHMEGSIEVRNGVEAAKAR